MIPYVSTPEKKERVLSLAEGSERSPLCHCEESFFRKDDEAISRWWGKCSVVTPVTTKMRRQHFTCHCEESASGGGRGNLLVLVGTNGCGEIASPDSVGLAMTQGFRLWSVF